MTVKLALIGATYWKQILLGSVGAFILIFIVFFGYESQPEIDPDFNLEGKATVSPLVLRYEPLITKYAEKYGVPEYVQLLMAKMMQESGGRGGDPMQASESIGLPPNGIQDPEQSIDAGVKYFSGLIKETKGDVLLALQSYNFGGGFISYALERGGYSKIVAIDFSHMMAKKMGWDRYGDVNYVDNVLRYMGASFGSTPVNGYGFMQPVNIPIYITSGFGYRTHPITGIPSGHLGVDLSCNKKNIPIYSTKKGKVTRSGWQDPGNHGAGYGQRVYIDHGNGQVTVYGHLHKIKVKEGQEVDQGQQIGTCGTTGSSTGIHLHYELHLNGVKTDPTPYLK